ncbi:MAG: DUF5009 domain-containing protein [Paramuribaculum sp.]|nr:DUF5009 domain-containing protein [Paramuribaculum sp.]
MEYMHHKSRLASLDILRGLDLFLLVFAQPVIIAIGQAADIPWLNTLLYQLDHEVWEGFRVWDLVMPLFLFMVGTSMPFSFSKYIRNKDYAGLYRKIIRRVIILFFFGMIVQGNILGFDLSRIYIYTNTLQAIAIGYLIASIIILSLPLRAQIAVTVSLLVIYWIPMKFCGDYSLYGSFAYSVDKAIIGKFRGDITYTWIWSSINFGVTVLTGYFAGVIIRNHSANKPRAACILFATGIALTAAGLLWSLEMPIIKRLWTSSMTLFSSGLCFILMSLFYYIIDCLGYTRGLNWLKIYGMNAITAYLLGEVINFRSIVSSVSYGLQPILGSYYNAWLTFGNFLILFLILREMYHRKIFLKI